VGCCVRTSAVTMCCLVEMKQRKSISLFSLFVRGSRGLWFLIIFMFILFSLIPWLYFRSDFSSQQSPTNFEDPFFTTTARGMRKCYPYESEPSGSLGYLLIDSPHLHYNQTQQDSLRSNFLHSIRRFGRNPFIRILESKYVTKVEKLILLMNFIESHLTSLPQVLLISTSLEGILMLSSSEEFEESFYSSKQRIIFSRENPNGLFIGYTEDILGFYRPMTLRSGLLNDKNLKEIVEQKVLSDRLERVIGFASDHSPLLLASQSSSSFTLINPPPLLIQLHSATATEATTHAVAATASQFSFLYNSYLHSSSDSTTSRSHLQHSYNHFLSHRSQYRVVISLTTLPHRLPHLLPVLQSLLNQHVKPDQVYLNLPTSYRRFNSTSSTSPPTIPIEIQRLVLNDILRIQLTSVDYGPATKLIPTLEAEKEPSTIIITVDDDMIYKPTQVQLLLRAYFHFPHAAYGYAGQLIDLDLRSSSKGSSRKMRGWKITSKKKKETVAVRTAWQWKVTLSSLPFHLSLSSLLSHLSLRIVTMLWTFSKLSAVHCTEETSSRTFQN
jgi:hypothetical protein